MTISDIYNRMMNSFYDLQGTGALLDLPVRILADTEPEQTLRPDGDTPSSVSRPEYRVTAILLDHHGEAYTEHPMDFDGTLREALTLPCSDDGIDARTIAALNAAMSVLGQCPGTFSDDPAVHQQYADAICNYLIRNYGRSHIILVGYDGYFVKRFMEEELDFWTMDRDPDHITKDRFNHVIVNSGKYNRESCFAWGKIFVITGSTLCNGTITQYLDQGKDLLFYGITCAGASRLVPLPWFSTDGFLVF